MTRLLHRGPLAGPLAGPRALVVAMGLSMLFVGLAAGRYVSRIEPGYIPMPLVLLVGLAGGVILFTITAEQVFLAWLILAPLVQAAPNTATGHALDLALFTAPAAIVLCQTLLRPAIGRPREWFDYLPGAYVLLVTGSFFVTTNLWHTATVSSFKVLFLNVALGPLLYYFVAFRATEWLTATRVVRVFLLSCAVEALMSIVEWATGWNLWHDDTWHLGLARSVGTLANPATLGAFVGAGVVVSIAILAWNGPDELRRLSKAVILLGVPGVMFTLTRGPILATASIAIVVLILNSRTRVVAVGALVVAALALVVLWPHITNSTVYQTRVAKTSNVQARVILQDLSLRLAARRPLLGWGYESFDRVKTESFKADARALSLSVDETTSHDTYLTILVQYGGLGLLLLLLPSATLCVLSVRRARAPSPERWLLVGAPAVVAVLVLTGATIDYRFFSYVPAMVWLFLGLVRPVVREGDVATFAS